MSFNIEKTAGLPFLSSRLKKKYPDLYYIGNRDLFRKRSIAIVGSRNVDTEHRFIAQWIAGLFVDAGFNIVSGYAKGIDSAAHSGALRVRGGTTTAVLPYGLKQFHRRKEFEFLRWDENALVLSQFEPESTWANWRAIVRNELVCALSEAVIVIASDSEVKADGKKSGTFSTARLAFKLAKPLFVVEPEAFKNPLPGNRELIALGAYRLPLKEVYLQPIITAIIDGDYHEPVLFENI